MSIAGIKAFIGAFLETMFPDHCRWCDEVVVRLPNGQWAQKLSGSLLSTRCDYNISLSDNRFHEVD